MKYRGKFIAMGSRDLSSDLGRGLVGASQLVLHFGLTNGLLWPAPDAQYPMCSSIWYFKYSFYGRCVTTLS